ncbi:chemotaxis protein [Halalkalibacter akibai]|uniref:Chemotaxis protein CheV n=1 Tax=Halalkalibacter akibai (strain ATCC 43226 / DSM 21942 / CIP 109018 / JCM 9157 / 1139) TaxID=1236973 RepID=W4QUA7_HALA3|nr:chemotaxis protein [Halalkalibacter akibai]GAE35755.1 chemotaxis protein CheV [Halalkalibacter akibai JCM 9157]
MSETTKSNILLESGTNELEIIMFTVHNSTFGINVLKVREIINPLPITPTPNGHENVEGIIRLRQEVIPVVNLAKVLNLPESEQPEQDKFIISELNKTKVAFHVHSVSRIHRISWEQIEKPSELSQGGISQTIGIVKMDDMMALLLDFEKVVVDINPEAGLSVDKIKALGPRKRSTKRILIAEDSAILRKLLYDTLSEAGYENLQFFENGRSAWEHLQLLAEEGSDEVRKRVDIIITDIEMPQMDGHHLTVKIKGNKDLAHLPVVIFSSLITNDLFHKGEKVGADAQVSKPEIVKLVETIDKYVLN